MGSTLDTTPRTATTARGVGSNAEPVIPPPAYTALGQALRRAGRDDYHAWLDHIRPAAGCTRPIRLVGTIDTIDAVTAQRLHRLHTNDLPDAVIYKACGNRRSSVCPSCAHTYQRDAYHLLRAGLVGGKGIPATVAQHPAVFATFTAPSFGTVHTRVVRRHTCGNRRRCDCRAEPCHPRRANDPTAGPCEHGRPAVCWTRHEDGDPLLGSPLCLDCYDHDHQVVWNIHTGELWRRTKQAAERYLAHLARTRGIPPVVLVSESGKTRRVPPVRLSPGKVAELQARGAVHFHAIARLDGIHPDDPDAIVPPPDGFTTADLDAALRHAAQHITLHTPPHPDQPQGWLITWGDQLDIRPITIDGEVTDAMVAGYLAKYATKSTEATGHNSTRITTENVNDYADPDGDHIARLIHACWRLGRPTTSTATPRNQQPAPDLGQPWTRPTCAQTTRLAACPTCPPNTRRDTYVSKPATTNPYTRLRRWAHMLGFGGHFLTKARRYSITFALLRTTRVTYRRTEHHHDHTEAVVRAVDHLDEEPILILSNLTFAGAGWHTTGDALLANTAAALARERQRIAREELAHETGSAPAAPIPTAA